MSMDRPLGATAPDLAQASREARDAKLRRDEAERWAAALLTTLTRDEGPAPRALTAEPPTDWQTSDGSLTPSGASMPTATTSESSETSSTSRIRLDVSTGELGDVAVVVDRSAGGVRVWLGVEHAQTKAIFEPERRALELALKASGLDVRSVQVVETQNLGTVLARGMARQRYSDANDAKHGEAERKRRGSRRLNFFG